MPFFKFDPKNARVNPYWVCKRVPGGERGELKRKRLGATVKYRFERMRWEDAVGGCGGEVLVERRGENQPAKNRVFCSRRD